MSLKKWLKKIKGYRDVIDFAPACRRYFVLNSFDGVLTAFGVILGAFAVGELSKGIVMGAAVGAGIALAMSGIVSAYEVERLENKMRLQKIEKAMMKNTGEFHLNASRFATTITAIVYSISAMATVFIPVIPFFVFEPTIAMYVAIFVTLLFLFIIGAYMGSLVKEKIFFSGLRFTFAGIGTAVVLYLIKLFLL